MTDNIRNASGQAIQYRAPQVKVIVVKAQRVLCRSPYGNPTEFDEENEN